MTVYQGLTVFLVVVLGTFTTAAIWLGLLNWLGVFHVVRCQKCHHLTASTSRQLQESCPHCRHPILTHPLHAAHHPRSAGEVKVVDDQLHY